MKDKSVKLIENFQSYQGEGPDMGRAMIILRFKTCNLKCGWCDTSVKMRISAEAPYKLSDIQKIINETRSGILITGGEPTVPRHFDECLMLLNELEYPIANIESNGFNLEKLVEETKMKRGDVHFMYSPKIFTRDDYREALEKTEIFFKYHKVHIKLVYEDKELIKAYCRYLNERILQEENPHHLAGKVWLMPEGTTRTDLIRNSGKVFDACERYRFNFSSRSHIIYGFV